MPCLLCLLFPVLKGLVPGMSFDFKLYCFLNIKLLLMSHPLYIIYSYSQTFLSQLWKEDVEDAYCREISLRRVDMFM